MDPKILEDLAKKLGAALPDGLQSLQRDVEKNFKTILQSAFSRMDLVTREEFDVQTEVLKRSREKLDKMEQKITSLEEKINQ